MSSFWKLADLEIIGYADDRDATMLPAVVPPVFRLKADSDVVLLPPYSLHFDAVVGATAVTMEEAEHLRLMEQITLFPAGGQPAEPGHQMWLHRDGRRVYQPVHEARRTLDQLSAEAIERAILQLAKGQLDLAEDSASEAILSNDRRVEPLAIKAAIRRRRGLAAEARLMGEIARPLIESGAFVNLVNYYTRLITAIEPVRPVLKSLSPMDAIATIPARAARA